MVFLPLGILGGAEPLRKTHLPSIFSCSWMEETLPIWGAQLLTVARPSLQLAWDHTNATINFLSAHCAAHLTWLGDSISSLSHRVYLGASESEEGWSPPRQPA